MRVRNQIWRNSDPEEYARKRHKKRRLKQAPRNSRRQSPTEENNGSLLKIGRNIEKLTGAKKRF